ncbi:MAG: GNAT family N-acetyltransferase [Muribaculaceae bacterium]
MKLDEELIKIKEIDTLDDIYALVVNRVEYLKELQGDMTDEYQELLKNDLHSFITSAMHDGAMRVYTVTYKREPVSFGIMLFKRIPGDRNNCSFLEADIMNMYTLPKYRKCGLSSMLLDVMIEKARHIGVVKLSLHTSKAGEKMYRNHGFNEPQFPVLELNL